MSLSYSLWSNANSNNTSDKSQKRQPTMSRSTLKKRQAPKPASPIRNMSGPDEYMSTSEAFQNQSSMEESESDNRNRESRVNELLNKITSVNVENEGDRLMNFEPMSKPNYSTKKESFADGMQNVYEDNEIPFPENELYNPPPNVEKKTNGYPSSYQESQTGMNSSGGRARGPYSNYSTTYSNPNILYPNYSKSNRGGSGMGGGYDSSSSSNHNLNRILEKINYVVHMLEEQQNEKTSNITEEFILYTFLGVFVIFIVDSFSRSGKYVR